MDVDPHPLACAKLASTRTPPPVLINASGSATDRVSRLSSQHWLHRRDDRRHTRRSTASVQRAPLALLRPQCVAAETYRDYISSRLPQKRNESLVSARLLSEFSREKKVSHVRNNLLCMFFLLLFCAKSATFVRGI